MNLQSIKNKLKSKATKDIVIAIEDLESRLVSESSLLNDLLILRSRLESIERLERTDQLNYSATQIEKNRITDSFLKIIDKITPVDLEEELSENNNATVIQIKKPSRILIFDIDNTVLRKGESLKILGRDHKNLIDIFKQLITYNFHIVFITGNDIEKQTPRVLKPIIKSGIGEHVTVFSDGGSRLFEFPQNGKAFKENLLYSRENEISSKVVKLLEKEFLKELKAFVDGNEWLTIPDIELNGFKVDLDGYFEYSEILVRPFNKSFYKSQLLTEFKNEIKSLAKKKRVNSSISFPLEDNSSLLIHLEGDNSHTDGFKISDIIRQLISFKKFKSLSKPEIIIRGGKGFTSQVALKPFKDYAMRENFMKKFIKRIKKYDVCKNLSINLGGRSTIDIQLKNVDKAKAIRFLVDNENYNFNPALMIYFGDEFTKNGNDLPVLLMEDDYRPGLVIHVGDLERTPEVFFENENLLIDSNGPNGTINYLRYMVHELKLNELKNN